MELNANIEKKCIHGACQTKYGYNIKLLLKSFFSVQKEKMPKETDYETMKELSEHWNITCKRKPVNLTNDFRFTI